jgi:NADH dehydrogenase
MKVVVLGGGYAGLSCLLALADRLPQSERVLVDPGRHHLKLTRLQEALRRPLDDLRVPFDELSRQFGFRHIAARPPVGSRALARYAEERRLVHGDLDERFDVLVVAVGARPRPRPRQPGCLGLADLKHMDGRRLLERVLAAEGRRRRRITVVGGGATGLQYLFELRDALRREGAGARLTLVDASARLLPEQPRSFHDYVRRRLRQGKITYRPGYLLRDAAPGSILLGSREGDDRVLPSDHTFVFTGLIGNPAFRETAETGQVVLGGEQLPNVFAAGDCSRYRGGGLDTASAQAAVRKGRHVAANIARLTAGRSLRPYGAPELGFFLSLGMLDGIGWMGDPRAVVTGVAAFAVREAIEARYELFVKGVDTFQVL